MDHRRPRRVAALLAGLAPPLLAFAAAAPGQGGERAATARAASGASARATAFVTARGTSRGGVAVAGAGSRSRAVSLSGADLAGRASVAASAGGREARASVRARGVSAFGGLVRATTVTWSAAARDGRGARGGAVGGLRIGGRPVAAPRAGRTYGAGSPAAVTVEAGAGLTVRLTRSYRGWAAGTTVVVGRAAAAAPAPPPRAVAPEPAAKRPAPQKAAPAPRRGREAAPRARTRSRGEKRAGRRGKARARAPKAPPVRLTGDRYAFPVRSREAATSDGFGAPREIGAHQGNDIFAPFGTPVVAVSDGTLNRVGTLPVSGNRLWLKAPGGDSFFYAHMSYFSPAAVNGARVKAGTVLGYVGNTGDAEPTPPHLHFEIHPKDGDAVDPYPFLVAWQRRQDAPAGAWADTAERPGTLVQTRDFIAR